MSTGEKMSEQIFDDIIRNRRSIFKYTDEKVPIAIIREILTLANQAPNISNRQMWRFIAITETKLLGMIARLVEKRIDSMSEWPEFSMSPRKIPAIKELALSFGTAPLVIGVVNTGYTHPMNSILMDHGMSAWEIDRLYSYPEYQSLGAVMAFMTLAAQSRGYGSNWITEALIARNDIQLSLELKPKEELAGLITIGKPAEMPEYKPRRPLGEILEWK
jgi:nitroreductase